MKNTFAIGLQYKHTWNCQKTETEDSLSDYRQLFTSAQQVRCWVFLLCFLNLVLYLDMQRQNIWINILNFIVCLAKKSAWKSSHTTQTQKLVNRPCIFKGEGRWLNFSAVWGLRGPDPTTLHLCSLTVRVHWCGMSRGLWLFPIHCLWELSNMLMLRIVGSRMFNFMQTRVKKKMCLKMLCVLKLWQFKHCRNETANSFG